MKYVIVETVGNRRRYFRKKTFGQYPGAFWVYKISEANKLDESEASAICQSYGDPSRYSVEPFKEPLGLIDP